MPEDEEKPFEMSSQYRDAMTCLLQDCDYMRSELIRRSAPEDLVFYAASEDPDWSVVAQCANSSSASARVMLKILARIREARRKPEVWRRICVHTVGMILEPVSKSVCDLREVAPEFCNVCRDIGGDHMQYIHEVLKRKDCPMSLLEEYASKVDFCGSVLRNSHASEGVIRKAYTVWKRSRDSKEYQPYDAAGHENSPVDVLRDIAEAYGKDERIARVLVKNPRCPSEVLELFADHKADDEVAKPARQHPNATPLVCVKAAAAGRITLRGAVNMMGGKSVFVKAWHDSPGVQKICIDNAALRTAVMEMGLTSRKLETVHALADSPPPGGRER